MYLCIVQIMTDIRYFIDYTIYITEDGKFKGFIITTHETIEDLWDGRPSLHRDYTNEIKIEEIKNWVPTIIEDIDETVKFLTNVKNMKDHNDIIKNVKKSWSISEEISNFLKEIEVLKTYEYFYYYE